VYPGIISIFAVKFWWEESGETTHDFICVSIQTAFSLLTVNLRKGKRLAELNINPWTAKGENLSRYLPGT
jgi:hypothetical protein